MRAPQMRRQLVTHVNDCLNQNVTAKLTYFTQNANAEVESLKSALCSANQNHYLQNPAARLLRGGNTEAANPL